MKQKYMWSFVFVTMFAVAGGCADAVEPPGDKDGIEEPTFLPDGETRATPQQIDPFEDVQTGEDPKVTTIAADCVYVQWCNEPGPAGTICRLRPGCFYNQTTVDECIRDTRAVCGAPILPWYLF